MSNLQEERKEMHQRFLDSQKSEDDGQPTVEETPSIENEENPSVDEVQTGEVKTDEVNPSQEHQQPVKVDDGQSAYLALARQMERARIEGDRVAQAKLRKAMIALEEDEPDQADSGSEPQLPARIAYDDLNADKSVRMEVLRNLMVKHPNKFAPSVRYEEVEDEFGEKTRKEIKTGFDVDNYDPFTPEGGFYEKELEKEINRRLEANEREYQDALKKAEAQKTEAQKAKELEAERAKVDKFYQTSLDRLKKAERYDFGVQDKNGQSIVLDLTKAFAIPGSDEIYQAMLSDVRNNPAHERHFESVFNEYRDRHGVDMTPAQALNEVEKLALTKTIGVLKHHIAKKPAAQVVPQKEPVVQSNDPSGVLKPTRVASFPENQPGPSSPPPVPGPANDLEELTKEAIEKVRRTGGGLSKYDYKDMFRKSLEKRLK